MTSCNGCIYKVVCGKARHIENYKIIGGCDLYRNEKNFVEVVRCKDCKWFDQGTTLCEMFMVHIDGNGYCCSGVRRVKK